MASLVELGQRHGSDKLAHGYLEHYDRHFSSLRDSAERVLEIGVGGYGDPTRGGASLRMWADYFARARVVGLDVQEKRLDLPSSVTVVQGSQADPAVLDRVVADHGPFDVIVDDGSHANAHRNLSFTHLFPTMPSGGVYALEDLHTSYLRQFGGGAHDLLDPAITTGLLKELIDGLHHAYVPGRPEQPFDASITGLSVYPKLAFVTKGENRPTVAWNDQAAIDRELEVLRGRADP